MSTGAHADAFGNEYAAGLPYARGAILRNGEHDFQKIRKAWSVIADRISNGEPVFNLTGLERSLPRLDETVVTDDELSAALYVDELTSLGLDHLGGSSPRDDLLLTNRLTAALFSAVQVMLPRRGTAIGVSPSYSHPAVVRAVRDAGGILIDTTGLDEFEREMASRGSVDLVILTRLAVTYDIMSEQELEAIVELARRKNARILVDDAGGARIGPAVLHQSKTLQLDVDAGATGLDKYGTVGPRLGMLGGRRGLVSAIRVRAIELGMEARPMLYPTVIHSLRQYSPLRVRALVDSTKGVTQELRKIADEVITEKPVIAQLRGQDILRTAMDRTGLDDAPIVPIEATAGLAMILLQDFGILTVHFAGLPPGTDALLIKFLPPETVADFGGPKALARAIDSSITRLAGLLRNPKNLEALLTS